jgi:hypothetical protein
LLSISSRGDYKNATYRQDRPKPKAGQANWTHKKTGEPKEHPAAKRMDALRRDYLKALTMLGLRASVAEPEPDKSGTLEGFLSE